MLRRVIPWSTAVFWPPGGNRDYVEVFGTKIEDVAEEGAHSLMTKLRSAGLPRRTCPAGPPIPVGLPPREAAERGLALMGAGILGPKERPNARDPETVALALRRRRALGRPRARPHRRRPSCSGTSTTSRPGTW